MPRKENAYRIRKAGFQETAVNSSPAGNGGPGLRRRPCKEVKTKKQPVLCESKIRSRHYDLSFSDVQQLWTTQNSVHLKASTQRKYNYLLQSHILPAFANTKISQMNAPVINAFLANKIKSGRLDGSGGLSASYVRSIMLVINSIMLFAASEKYCLPLSSNICKPALTAKEIPILDRQQCKMLESAICVNPTPTEIGILIALYAGLRLGEICALSWSDVDLENSLITVRHTISRINVTEISTAKSVLIIDSPKTPSSLRVVPICSKLLKLLTEYRKRSISQYVVSTSEAFVSPRTFEYRFHATLKRHGIQDIHFHALRHTFATRCIENSVDVKSLSEILGHSTEAITLKTYVHSSLDLKRTQLEKLSCSI